MLNPLALQLPQLSVYMMKTQGFLPEIHYWIPVHLLQQIILDKVEFPFSEGIICHPNLNAIFSDISFLQIMKLNWYTDCWVWIVRNSNFFVQFVSLSFLMKSGFNCIHSCVNQFYTVIQWIPHLSILCPYTFFHCFSTFFFPSWSVCVLVFLRKQRKLRESWENWEGRGLTEISENGWEYNPFFDLS